MEPGPEVAVAVLEAAVAFAAPLTGACNRPRPNALCPHRASTASTAKLMAVQAMLLRRATEVRLVRSRTTSLGLFCFPFLG